MEYYATHPDVLSILTEREHEVVKRLAVGLTNIEVAEELGISHRTVETHRLRAMEKMYARNLAEMIWALNTGQPGRRPLKKSLTTPRHQASF